MHEHEFQGQKLRHDHPGGEQPHGYFEHPEDGFPRVSGTPLADALALVDAAQGNDIEGERRLVSLSFTDAGTARELAALRELAEAVRASLGAFSEGDVRDVAGAVLALWDIAGGQRPLSSWQYAAIKKARELFGDRP